MGYLLLAVGIALAVIDVLQVEGQSQGWERPTLRAIRHILSIGTGIAIAAAAIAISTALGLYGSAAGLIIYSGLGLSILTSMIFGFIEKKLLKFWSYVNEI